MTRSALAVLGIGQCVNWGVLYYAFAVLVLPLQQELEVPAWVITGAFSLALFMSAALAPAAGRWADTGHGARMMEFGGVAAAALLAGWTLAPGVVMLYLVWAGLGLCMALTLYEPAFVLIGRAHSDPRRRLRALATVTLFGGLASTVFLPATGLLVAAGGWRAAALVLAGVLLLSTAITNVLVFRHLPTPRAGLRAGESARVTPAHADHSVDIFFLVGVFSVVSLTSAAVTANLFPVLGERGLSPSLAATLGGLMGVMQLPGRALLMHGAFAGSPMRLLTASLTLLVVGLGALALSPSAPVVVAGALVFALGAGLMTVVRPHLVHTIFSGPHEGHLNGRIARHQQLARAAGPLTVAWTASVFSYGTVFAVIAAALATALLSLVMLGSGTAMSPRREAA